jgi:hypothetical protein
MNSYFSQTPTVKTRYYLLKRVVSREERLRRSQEYVKRYKRLAKQHHLQIQKSEKKKESRAASHPVTYPVTYPVVAPCLVLEDDEENATPSHQSDSQDCTVIEAKPPPKKVDYFKTSLQILKRKASKVSWDEEQLSSDTLQAMLDDGGFDSFSGKATSLRVLFKNLMRFYFRQCRPDRG